MAAGLSSSMIRELVNVAQWELLGYLGVPACRMPRRTCVALDKMGLIEINVDGSYRLSTSGRTLVMRRLGGPPVEPKVDQFSYR